MYAYFDDTKRFWYYLLFTYSMCIPLYIVLRYMQISIIFSCILVFVIEILCYMFIMNTIVQKANGYMKTIEDMLYQDLDIQAFQKEVAKLLKKNVKNQTQRCRLQYLMAISLSIQGKTQEALALYDMMKEDVVRLRNLEKWPIYIAMAHAYMDADKLEQANGVIKQAQECKENTRDRNLYENEVAEVMQRYQYCIGEESGQVYIDFLKAIGKEKGNTPFHKLYTHIQLMDLSKRTKHDKDAKLCAYYIVKHGKDLPCVDAANKLLEGTYE